MIIDYGKNRRLEDYGLKSFDDVRKILPDRSKLDAYSQRGVGRSHPIPIRVPLRLLDRIEDIRKSFRLRTRSEATLWLLQMGIIVVDVKEKIKDPQIVEQLRKFQSDTRVVDYASTIPDEVLDALYTVVRNEKEIRSRR